MDFFETAKRFIDNGGVFGYLNGFDAEEKGRPYNFDDLKNDIENVGTRILEITGSLMKTMEVVK